MAETPIIVNLNLFKTLMSWWRCAVVAVACVPLQNIAAPPEIQPFHTLTWNDGIVEAVTKLNQIPGMKTLQWCRESGNKRDVYFDPTKLEPVALAERLGKIAPDIYRFNHSFVDVDGTTSTAPERTSKSSSLSGGPVNIAGIPFDISVSLSTDYGFAIVLPNRVLQANVDPNKMPVKLPVKVEAVHLKSNSLNNAENLKKLIDTAKAKYPAGVVKEVGNTGVRQGLFSYSDAARHTFKIEWLSAGNLEIEISYTPDDSQKLAEIYRKHVETKSKSDVKTPDLKSGL